MGLGLLLVGILAGAAGAQAVQNFGPPSFLNWGLFTLAADEEVHFNVTLREVPRGPQAQVLQQLFDRSGALVARQIVTLGPGKSATLRYTLPGEFSAHAEILDLSNGPFGASRIIAGTVEILGRGAAGAAAGTFAVQSLDDGLTPRRFVPSSDDGGGNGRLPD
jgi:hypothetical protein